MTLGTEFFILLISAAILIYLWSQNVHSYWKRKKVPFISPTFFFGNIKNIVLFRKCTAYAIQEMYNDERTKDEPVVGINLLYTPALLIKDLNIAKRILMKDFQSFSNRYSGLDRHNDPLGYYNMFFVKNPEWKEVRTSISPIFTSGKIKQMFVLVNEIAKELDLKLCNMEVDPKNNSFCTEIKDVCALFTTDVIASIAFGIRAKSLQNPDGEFRKNGKDIFSVRLGKAIDLVLVFFQPKVAKFFKRRFFSVENTNFLNSAINHAMKSREESGIQRNDLIDILLVLKKTAKKNDVTFNNDMLVGQAAVFFSAGFESSSSTMSFALYELCRSIDCQKRLRNEIKMALVENKGELTYDVVMDMEYLNMVVMEVLRLYPPLPILDRECTASNGYSLEPDVHFVIPHGMPIYVPNFAVQRDPQYFPDPEKFDPERFAPHNKDKIVPYSYMPFGLGPHNCIGERFGLLQAKIGLIAFLRNHYVLPMSKTPATMKLNRKALIIQSESGIYCDIVRDPLFT